MPIINLKGSLFKIYIMLKDSKIKRKKFEAKKLKKDSISQNLRHKTKSEENKNYSWKKVFEIKFP